ncbi:UNKNOWN [Stylonychia lemnae]|uniref:Uncharacterized protein n=1 Tax=Stylonychia lemnae TaxID=5949 RepID=A0A078AKA5_STYLE|nr:UNKNOWN [Stylonychia lemnae]|eukprot:CDW81238.1 UNKNOWN [Stylonychia lemnae]
MNNLSVPESHKPALVKQSSSVSRQNSARGDRNKLTSPQADDQGINIFDVKIDHSQKTAYFVPIDEIYHQERQKLSSHLHIMQHQFQKDPDKFQVVVKRNLNSFVEDEKEHQDKKLSNMLRKQAKYVSQFKETERVLKEIREQYGLKVNENEKMTFQSKLQMDCNSKNYFYTYKKERVQRLKDDEMVAFEEPFHVKLIREEQERIEKENKIKLKQKAILNGDISALEQIELSSDENEELLSPRQTAEIKLQKWVKKNKKLREKDQIRKSIMKKNSQLPQSEEKMKKLSKTENHTIEFGEQSMESKTVDYRPQSVSSNLFKFNLKLKNTPKIINQLHNISQDSKPHTTARLTAGGSVSTNTQNNRSVGHHASVSFDMNSKGMQMHDPQLDEKTFISLMRTGQRMSSGQNGPFSRPDSFNRGNMQTAATSNSRLKSKMQQQITLNESTLNSSIYQPDTPTKKFQIVDTSISIRQSQNASQRLSMRTSSMQKRPKTNNLLSKSLNMAGNIGRVQRNTSQIDQDENSNSNIHNLSSKMNLDQSHSQDKAFKQKNNLDFLKHFNASFIPTKFFSKRRFNSVALDQKSNRANDSSSDQRRPDSRFNLQFKAKTPSINDSDVRQLVKQYPTNYINVKEYIQKNQSKKDEKIKEILEVMNHDEGNANPIMLKRKQTLMSIREGKSDELMNNNKTVLKVIMDETQKKEQKKKLLKIMHLCKRVEDQWPKEKNDTDYKLLLEHIKKQEFWNVIDQVKEIDFAEPGVIPLLYQYKAADFNDNVKLAIEVAQEYKSGKLDPKMAMQNERTTKQMLKRGMFIH